MVKNKFVQVVHYFGVNLDLGTIALFAALDMAELTAFNTFEKFHLALLWLGPHLETSSFSVTYVVAFLASDDVGLCAVSGLMANLVAFEAHLLCTVEGLMFV